MRLYFLSRHTDIKTHIFNTWRVLNILFRANFHHKANITMSLKKFQIIS